jgi:acyl-CoA thioester hydrolase
MTQSVDFAGLSRPTRDQFKFFHDLRVRYSEVDRQGIVFNAHYLTYFDTAITEFFRSVDCDYQTFVATTGLDFHVVKSTAEYLKGIGFDEVIEIGVSVHKIGKSSITFALAIFKKGASECLAKGEIVWVCSRVGTNKSSPIPADVMKVLSPV